MVPFSILDVITWKGIVTTLMGTRSENEVISCKYPAACEDVYKRVAEHLG